MNVLITGANRGIGLGFVRHYLDRGHDVWACHRARLDGLATLSHAHLRLVEWDVTQPQPRGGAPLPDRLDLVINNAGIWSYPKDAPQSLERVSVETMREVFEVDCIGAIRVLQHVLPRLFKARGVVANISSKMGSSADNTSGGYYAYRAAKAALAIVSKSMAIDLAPKGVRVITLHPGWVRTDMTDHGGLIDVATSVAGMARIIESIDDYAPGAFIAYDGKGVPY
jgi:NAD(P)-dependent dehydrogenase (short-subunit alcohol dehydrogenase family)